MEFLYRTSTYMPQKRQLFLYCVYTQIASIFAVQGTYPIFHANGEIQKLAVVATKNHKHASLAWSLLMKLQKSPMLIQSGYLGSPQTNKKGKSNKKTRILMLRRHPDGSILSQTGRAWAFTMTG